MLPTKGGLLAASSPGVWGGSDKPCSAPPGQRAPLPARQQQQSRACYPVAEAGPPGRTAHTQGGCQAGLVGCAGGNQAGLCWEHPGRAVPRASRLKHCRRLWGQGSISAGGTRHPHRPGSCTRSSVLPSSLERCPLSKTGK